MAEPFLFLLFKIIWQDLVENVAYDSTKQDWQALQVVIDEIKNNKQVSEDLAFALYKCFYFSDKNIAQKCREELIKSSTFTQYRGAKIYKPSENDTAIRKLENKINFLEKQLKQIDKKKLAKSVLTFDKLEDLLKQISQTNYESSQEAKKIIQNQLFEEAETDCDVKIYKTRLREQENGLRKQIFNSFLVEIEPNEQLNRIFNARTYLILNKIREKV